MWHHQKVKAVEKKALEKRPTTDKVSLPSMDPLDHMGETRNTKRSTGVKENGNAPVAQLDRATDF